MSTVQPINNSNRHLNCTLTCLAPLLRPAEPFVGAHRIHQMSRCLANLSFQRGMTCRCSSRLQVLWVLCQVTDARPRGQAGRCRRGRHCTQCHLHAAPGQQGTGKRLLRGIRLERSVPGHRRRKELWSCLCCRCLAYIACTLHPQSLETTNTTAHRRGIRVLQELNRVEML